MRTFLSVALIFGCSITIGFAQSDTELTKPIFNLPSSNNDIKIRIDDNQRNWRVSPNVSPDRLIVECKNDQFTNVTFTTDKEEKTFQLSGKDLIQFNVVLDDGEKALTEIKCIKPRTRYRGDYSPARATSGNYQQDLPPLLDTYFKDDRAGATLAIWKKGQLIFEYSKGLSNIENKTPRNTHQPFDIASISKEFTAVAILQLVEKEKIQLDDKLEDYISGLPNGKNITIHHLLTHTHGLPDVMQSDEFDGILQQNKKQTLQWLSKMRSKFQPGEKYEYGNTAYFVLSVIVERVSGTNLKKYIRDHLFNPAGMAESYFLTDKEKQSVRVTGYNEKDGISSIRTFEYHDSQASGTGDIVSTANDLKKWQFSLTNNIILSKEMFDLATTPKTLNDGTKLDRGYGFAFGQFNGETAIYNTGDFYTHTRHFYLVDQDLSLVLNMNGTLENDGGLASIVFLQIIGKILNQQSLEMFDDVIDVNEL